MVLLSDLIQVHNNALEPEICDSLISIYESLSDRHERYDEDKKPSFTQLNLTQSVELSPDIHRIHTHLIQKTYQYRDMYYEYIDKRVFPDSHAFEQFRIKKYNPGGDDMFDTHVDVVDHTTARRFLSFFWYLNDVEVGGQTVFSDLTIDPRRGKLVVFPPLWTYPHRGDPPVSSPKYIISTYLHYK